MTNSQRREIERHLEDMLLSLRHQSQGTPEGTTPCPDENEYASSLAEMRMNVALQHRINKQMKEIEAALRRVEVADCGYCEECGEPIPMARLKANPTTTLCVGCQSELETMSALMNTTSFEYEMTVN